jgi:hypothetical protein
MGTMNDFKYDDITEVVGARLHRYEMGDLLLFIIQLGT